MSHSTQNLKVIENTLPQSQEEVIERLLAEFDELLEALYGPRTYRPFTV